MSSNIFPIPPETLRRCLELLKPDGILLIQTPGYRESKTYEQMTADNDYFLNHIRGKSEKEHLFLYSPKSVEALLKSIGVEHVQFEPAIFAIYDMFLVASRSPIKSIPMEEMEAALLASPSSRIALALLDLESKAQKEYGALLAERDKLRENQKSLELAQQAAHAILQSNAFKSLRALGRWEHIEDLLTRAFPGLKWNRGENADAGDD